MAIKLGRGLDALFGSNEPREYQTIQSPQNSLCIPDIPDVDVNRNQSKEVNNIGTPILPARNEEAIEIARCIEQAINLPTSLKITRKGGRLSIQCTTYEELETVVKKLTADV